MVGLCHITLAASITYCNQHSDCGPYQACRITGACFNCTDCIFFPMDSVGGVCPATCNSPVPYPCPAPAFFDTVALRCACPAGYGCLGSACNSSATAKYQGRTLHYFPSSCIDCTCGPAPSAVCSNGTTADLDNDCRCPVGTYVPFGCPCDRWVDSAGHSPQCSNCQCVSCNGTIDERPCSTCPGGFRCANDYAVSNPTHSSETDCTDHDGCPYGYCDRSERCDSCVRCLVWRDAIDGRCPAICNMPDPYPCPTPAAFLFDDGTCLCPFDYVCQGPNCTNSTDGRGVFSVFSTSCSCVPKSSSSPVCPNNTMTDITNNCLCPVGLHIKYGCSCPREKPWSFKSHASCSEACACESCQDSEDERACSTCTPNDYRCADSYAAARALKFRKSLAVASVGVVGGLLVVYAAIITIYELYHRRSVARQRRKFASQLQSGRVSERQALARTRRYMPLSDLGWLHTGNRLTVLYLLILLGPVCLCLFLTQQAMPLQLMHWILFAGIIYIIQHFFDTMRLTPGSQSLLNSLFWGFDQGAVMISYHPDDGLEKPREVAQIFSQQGWIDCSNIVPGLPVHNVIRMSIEAASKAVFRIVFLSNSYCRSTKCLAELRAMLNSDYGYVFIIAPIEFPGFEIWAEIMQAVQGQGRSRPHQQQHQQQQQQKSSQEPRVFLISCAFSELTPHMLFSKLRQTGVASRLASVQTPSVAPITGCEWRTVAASLTEAMLSPGRRKIIVRSEIFFVLCVVSAIIHGQFCISGTEDYCVELNLGGDTVLRWLTYMCTIVLITVHFTFCFWFSYRLGLLRGSPNLGELESAVVSLYMLGITSPVRLYVDTESKIFEEDPTLQQLIAHQVVQVVHLTPADNVHDLLSRKEGVDDPVTLIALCLDDKEQLTRALQLDDLCDLRLLLWVNGTFDALTPEEQAGLRSKNCLIGRDRLEGMRLLCRLFASSCRLQKLENFTLGDLFGLNVESVELNHFFERLGPIPSLGGVTKPNTSQATTTTTTNTASQAAAGATDGAEDGTGATAAETAESAASIAGGLPATTKMAAAVSTTATAAAPPPTTTSKTPSVATKGTTESGMVAAASTTTLPQSASSSSAPRRAISGIKAQQAATETSTETPTTATPTSVAPPSLMRANTFADEDGGGTAMEDPTNDPGRPMGFSQPAKPDRFLKKSPYADMTEEVRFVEDMQRRPPRSSDSNMAPSTGRLILSQTTATPAASGSGLATATTTTTSSSSSSNNNNNSESSQPEPNGDSLLQSGTSDISTATTSTSSPPAAVTKTEEDGDQFLDIETTTSKLSLPATHIVHRPSLHSLFLLRQMRFFGIALFLCWILLFLCLFFAEFFSHRAIRLIYYACTFTFLIFVSMMMMFPKRFMPTKAMEFPRRPREIVYSLFSGFKQNEVMISYSWSEYSSYARLFALQFPVTARWLDMEKMLPGTQLSSTTRLAAQRAKFGICVLSHSYLKSPACKIEFDIWSSRPRECVLFVVPELCKDPEKRSFLTKLVEQGHFVYQLNVSKLEWGSGWDTQEFVTGDAVALTLLRVLVSNGLAKQLLQLRPPPICPPNIDADHRQHEAMTSEGWMATAAACLDNPKRGWWKLPAQMLIPLYLLAQISLVVVVQNVYTIVNAVFTLLVFLWSLTIAVQVLENSTPPSLTNTSALLILLYKMGITKTVRLNIGSTLRKTASMAELKLLEKAGVVEVVQRREDSDVLCYAVSRNNRDGPLPLDMLEDETKRVLLWTPARSANHLPDALLDTLAKYNILIKAPSMDVVLCQVLSHALGCQPDRLFPNGEFDVHAHILHEAVDGQSSSGFVKRRLRDRLVPVK